MADLFSDGFESGNLTAWNANDGGGDFTAHADAALHGSYGGKVVINDTDWKFVQDETPSSETRYRCRFYLDPNALSMAEGSYFEIMRGISESWALVPFQFFCIKNSGVYKVQIVAGRDSGGALQGGGYTITDEPHCIEIDWYKSSGGNNGFLSLWVDGTLKETLSSLDNDTFNVGRVRWGAGFFSGAISGTIFLDDFASNNDGTLIGLLHKWNKATISKFNGVKVTKWNGVV